MDEKSNNTKTNSLPEQSAELSEFLQLLVSSGMIGDPKIANPDIRKIRMEVNRKAYHNTKMLLERYRDCCFMLSAIPETVAEELEKPYTETDQLVEMVDTELAMDNRRLENRLEHCKKARLCVDRLLEAVTVLKTEPNHGEVLYNLIYMKYIAPNKYTNEEIAEELNISVSTMLRYKKEAIDLISYRLWGASNSRTAIALEALEIFQKFGDLVN